MKNKSHLTAIARNKLSAPMRYLFPNGRPADKRILDYGCGRGFDVKKLCIEGYDPYFSPTLPKGKFDIITCNYVLNVIEKKARSLVLTTIWGLLKNGGRAYITVRRDIQKEGLTSKGTLQENVVLKLPVVKETSDYCMYLLEAK